MYRQWRRTMRGYKITRSYRDRFISGLFWRFVLGMTALLALEELTGQPSAAAQTLPDTLPIGVPAGESFMLLDEQPSSQMNLAGTLIHLPQARTKYPTITGAGYTIAVLDTGIDYNHPALVGRYRGGYDFVNNDSNPDDDHGHGTHVTGIVTSSDSTYIGIAPQVGYAAVKVLNALGSGTWANIESGLQWVIN